MKEEGSFEGGEKRKGKERWLYEVIRKFHSKYIDWGTNESS